MSQGDRLKKVINSLLESPKSFAVSINLPSATTIYDIISDRREITPALLKKIITTYPNLNSEWLLSGIGEMFSWKEQPGVINEDPAEYKQICRFCTEKERYIKMLEARIEDQKKMIETQDITIQSLRALGGTPHHASSG